MLTKCVNTLTGNLSESQKQIPINPKGDIKAYVCEAQTSMR